MSHCKTLLSILAGIALIGQLKSFDIPGGGSFDLEDINFGDDSSEIKTKLPKSSTVQIESTSSKPTSVVRAKEEPTLHSTTETPYYSIPGISSSSPVDSKINSNPFNIGDILEKKNSSEPYISKDTFNVTSNTSSGKLELNEISNSTEDNAGKTNSSESYYSKDNFSVISSPQSEPNKTSSLYKVDDYIDNNSSKSAYVKGSTLDVIPKQKANSTEFKSLFKKKRMLKSPPHPKPTNSTVISTHTTKSLKGHSGSEFIPKIALSKIPTSTAPTKAPTHSISKNVKSHLTTKEVTRHPTTTETTSHPTSTKAPTHIAPINTKTTTTTKTTTQTTSTEAPSSTTSTEAPSSTTSTEAPSSTTSTEAPSSTTSTEAPRSTTSSTSTTTISSTQTSTKVPETTPSCSNGAKTEASASSSKSTPPPNPATNANVTFNSSNSDMNNTEAYEAKLARDKATLVVFTIILALCAVFGLLMSSSLKKIRAKTKGRESLDNWDEETVEYRDGKPRPRGRLSV